MQRQVHVSIEGDGTARMTVSDDSDDHTFDVWTEGQRVLVEYQETCSWRGAIRVADPPDSVYRDLMQSDAMDTFIERHDCVGVRRAEPQS